MRIPAKGYRQCGPVDSKVAMEFNVNKLAPYKTDGQLLIEVFKICKGFSRIRPNELFHFDGKGKGIRGHCIKLVKVQVGQ